MLRLSDEGSNVSVLPTQQIHSLDPLSLNTFTEFLDTLKENNAIKPMKIRTEFLFNNYDI